MTPYDEEQKKISGNDKVEAATFAFIIIVMGIGILLGVGAALVALWQAGLTTAMVVIGVFSGLFAIGRAIYLTILRGI